jgi:ribosomal protein S18 acetylase RimI-like enzyme
LELVRDLRAPIAFLNVPFDFGMRWAEKNDLETINALEGYVKETTFLESSLESGDFCLIFEKDDNIKAFAWVTFKDFPLNVWHTLRLPPGYSYLVYIYVQPEYRNQKVGTCLLGCLMKGLK